MVPVGPDVFLFVSLHYCMNTCVCMKVCVYECVCMFMCCVCVCVCVYVNVNVNVYACPYRSLFSLVPDKSLTYFVCF